MGSGLTAVEGPLGIGGILCRTDLSPLYRFLGSSLRSRNHRPRMCKLC